MTEVIIPVILCGGSGTRLWPASRENYPKQFLRLIDDRSLLQNTVLRALRVSGTGAGSVVAVTLDAFAPDVAEQLAAIDPAATRHILREPGARSTAAAVAYAAAYVEKTFGSNAIMWILPADHHMGDEAALRAAFRHALPAAEQGGLVTFGIRATRPETGYGYIRVGAGEGAVRAAEAFVEKPDAAAAKDYIEAGNYLWNSGMFLFSAATVLEEYARHAPAILLGARAAMTRGGNPQSADAGLYMALPETPFDKAIMEKSSRVAVVPCDPGWSDIGAWDNLWDISARDGDGNAVEGRAALQDTKNCLIRSQGRLIACAGVENLVIVDTGDILLIADRRNGESLRALVKNLKREEKTKTALRADAE